MPRAENFSQMRRQFLEETYPELYEEMQKQGTLEEHLTQIGLEAEEMWEDLSATMSNDPDLPEDFASRVQRLNQIPEIVREIVSRELIHAPAM